MTSAGGTPRSSGTRARRSPCANPWPEAGTRRLSTLSGGEQKRLALEVLLRSDADVLLLDEPDNYLDVAGKRWLEESLARHTEDGARHQPRPGAARRRRGQGRDVGGSHGVDPRRVVRDLARSARRADRAHRRGPSALPRGAQAPGAVAQRVSPASRDGERHVRVPRAGHQDEDRAVRSGRADRAGARRAGLDEARRRPDRHTGRDLRAARARRSHRPVRLRGDLQRAHRGARPERHRQEPLPPVARGRAGRALGLVAARRARGARLLLARPTTSPSCAASRCSTR